MRYLLCLTCLLAALCAQTTSLVSYKMGLKLVLVSHTT